ncbi:hypothetical protein RR48_08559 [Papilio machaon]|uniref:Uncharacterized protein n=1 Tax=Papilio machaon TaxID=76193 RepID=A0A194RHR9_PAPMA|nr:hypothetical protein RR48_08559 [Papilio machaon]
MTNIEVRKNSKKILTVHKKQQFNTVQYSSEHKLLQLLTLTDGQILEQHTAT